MKNVRVRVRQCKSTGFYDYGIYIGKERILSNPYRKNGYSSWEHISYAIRAAKAMAKRIGIKYDPEIIKQHGC